MTSLQLFIMLVKRSGLLLVLAYLVTRSKWFSRVLKGQLNLRGQLLLMAVFGALACYGNSGGQRSVDTGTTASFIGAVAGGLLGGPVAGLGAGLIAAGYRVLYGVQLAMVPTAIALVLAGGATGLIHARTTGRTGTALGILPATLIAFALQALHVALLLALAPRGWALVRFIGLPTAAINTLGVGVVFFFVHNLIKEHHTQAQRDHFLSQKLKIEGELSVAKDIQMSLVPKMFPKTPHWPECSLYADLKSAREVGGDFYDFFLDKEGKLVFVIGDVSDKGVPAALFMAVTKTLIKGMSEAGQMPHELLAKVNREVEEGNDLNMFVTLFCAKLDFETGELWYSNAGHNPPALMRPGQAPQWLALPPGLVLGAYASSAFQTEKIILAPGDTLFAFTDGVTEAMNPAGRMYSEARLLETLHDWEGETPKDLVETIGDSVRAFAAGAPQSDDVTMIAVRYRGRATRAA